jgi:hypothetical protein
LLQDDGSDDDQGDDDEVCIIIHNTFISLYKLLPLLLMGNDNKKSITLSESMIFNQILTMIDPVNSFILFFYCLSLSLPLFVLYGI